MIKAHTLLAGCILDFILGDPRWLPHPVRLIGNAITAGERIARPFTAGSARRELVGGALLSLSVTAGSFVGARMLINSAKRVHPLFGTALEVTLLWTTLATRSLVTEATSVIDRLDSEDINGARLCLAMIVGRDTAELDQQQIARAVIETVAESSCDGIIAPLCYLSVGGVPLAFAYKAINTLDSMIGHRETPYLYFGRVAARTDDVANYLPARITAFAICASSAFVSGVDGAAAQRVWNRDGSRHASPNAGQSEAAMAGLLHVRLGGVNYYDGEPHQSPYLGAEYELPTVAAARVSIRVALAAALLACTAGVLGCWLRGNRKRFIR